MNKSEKQTAAYTDEVLGELNAAFKDSDESYQDFWVEYLTQLLIEKKKSYNNNDDASQKKINEEVWILFLILEDKFCTPLNIINKWLLMEWKKYSVSSSAQIAERDTGDTFRQIMEQDWWQ